MSTKKLYLPLKMKDLDNEGKLIEAFLIRNYRFVFGFISFTTVLFVLFCTYFSLTNYDTVVQPVGTPSGLFSVFGDNDTIRSEISSEIKETAEFDPPVLNSKCHLPKLKPFDESILPYVENPIPVMCPNRQLPLLFNKTFDSHLVLVDNPLKYGFRRCFYRFLIRVNTSDSSVKFSKEMFTITEMATKIPPDHEFIAINCSNENSSKIIDMFPFVPLKIEPKRHVPSNSNVNFVILGLDALSHMNFIRVMPKSYKFLTESLEGIGMNGYTKIGDNTFPNIVGALMGKSEAELENLCANKKDKYFDNCPFIWKNFSSMGYLTSFVEDSAWMSIFNYGKEGFQNPPTDYYTRPFSYMADNVIGSEKLLNAYLCNGPRLSFEIVLNYIVQTAVTMQTNKKNYFQFIWATSLFHDYLNEGKLGDEALLNMLLHFRREGFFRNTIFILMSDHGARWGDIRNTYQGKIEERMPFLYFLLPDKLLKDHVYALAMKNLARNKERLTTPFDLHETLKDFLNFTRLENEYISLKTESLENTTKKSRGISLFLPIPPDRDCESAGIDEHWCVCHSMKSIPVENNVEASKAANQAVTNINLLLKENPSGSCANLSLVKILSAQEMTVDNSEILGKDKGGIKEVQSELTLAVSFVTSPGNASFEATVKRSLKDTLSWTVLGDISRTNLYGNQSSCVQSYKLKKYCYCI